MMNHLSQRQLKILYKLLDKYEKSEGYINSSVKMQKKAIKPDEIMHDYYTTYDQDNIYSFVKEVKELEALDLIQIVYKNGVIDEIKANPVKWEEMYQLTGKMPKKDIMDVQRQYYESCNTSNPVIKAICEEKMAIINKGKIPKENNYWEDFRRTKKIIETCDNIMLNKSIIYEREFSQQYFKNSKEFGKYKETICKKIIDNIDMSDILYGLNWKDNKSEIEHIVLEEYNIYANPTYIFFKGNLTIVFQDGSIIKTSNDHSIGLSGDDIEKITSIETSDHNIITIENLTSYSRFHQDDYTAIFLSGYHGTKKKAFLKTLNKLLKNKTWYHFGDIDPDGFYILEHLKRSTGINFAPYKMDILTILQYKDYTKPLEENDILKANNLIKENKYTDILNFILNNNIKLEQEIVR